MNTDPFDISGAHYTPDPERDTALLIDGFFAQIAVTLRENDLPATVLDEMRARHAELTAANAHLVIDEPSRWNAAMALALVAAHEYLVPRLGCAESIAAVQVAFVEPLGDQVRAATRQLLDAAPDPFAAMVELTRARERDAFGPTFTFDHPADDERSYHCDVVRCFYHEVLVANSAPELTTVMCEFDANWIGAIDPAVDGFRFERATTIGRGGTHCPFNFDRV
ncbi:L-2-amino-thiazoline-4-carboxylic acid hydrolase [Nocardia arthritidis]|uniref:L-2-amino-thiazoline-4-carboxylic acid hydrolase n=1 Tax=Nocardia arthritidis TaxID=228602 RepID=A0A6G9YFT7_9NOCA|nr:L-2-amino-thiazoline-4-carboxylic acid hydrolase [Nocardia arthritidis]QIS12044.1 hypothetical protein F5544_20905 [Nocardia arthritidis]